MRFIFVKGPRREREPPGGSTRITSAPRSPRICPQSCPRSLVRSSTLYGESIAILPFHALRAPSVAPRYAANPPAPQSRHVHRRAGSSREMSRLANKRSPTDTAFSPLGGIGPGQRCREEVVPRRVDTTCGSSLDYTLGVPPG